MSKTMSNNTFKAGVLANGVGLAVPMAGAPLPCTCTLKSAAGGRAIQLSTDGGVEYFTPTYDVTSGTMVILNINANVTHVKFTGAANDTWGIQ